MRRAALPRGARPRDGDEVVAPKGSGLDRQGAAHRRAPRRSRARSRTGRPGGMKSLSRSPSSSNSPRMIRVVCKRRELDAHIALACSLRRSANTHANLCPAGGRCRVLPAFRATREGRRSRAAAGSGQRNGAGRRDSNPRPSPWQGDALPTEPLPLGVLRNAGVVPRARVELATPRFSVACSTN